MSPINETLDSGIPSNKILGNEPPGSASTSGPAVSIPDDALIILPVRNVVLFPGVVFPITINRAKSINAVQQAMREQRPIGLLLQRDPEVADPGPDDLYRIGTLVNIVRYLTGPDDTHHVVCQARRRKSPLPITPGSVSASAAVAAIGRPVAQTTSTPSAATPKRDPIPVAPVTSPARAGGRDLSCR